MAQLKRGAYSSPSNYGGVKYGGAAPGDRTPQKRKGFGYGGLSSNPQQGRAAGTLSQLRAFGGGLSQTRDKFGIYTSTWNRPNPWGKRYVPKKKRAMPFKYDPTTKGSDYKASGSSLDTTSMIVKTLETSFSKKHRKIGKSDYKPTERRALFR